MELNMNCVPKSLTGRLLFGLGVFAGCMGVFGLLQPHQQLQMMGLPVDGPDNNALVLISVISLATVNTAALYIVGSVRKWPGFPGFAIFSRVVMGGGLAAMAGMGIGPEAFWGAATWEWLGALAITVAWRYETGREHA
jgi:hypothetical protein